MNNTLHTRFQKRWKMKLPSDYIKIYDAGFLTYDDNHGIYFPQILWLSVDKIIRFKWTWETEPYFIPFAETARRDYFCWCVKDPSAPYIADCPRDSIYAYNYASSFSGCLYRLLLWHMVADSMTAAFDEDENGLRKRLIRYIEHAQIILQKPWIDTLNDIMKRPSSRIMDMISFVSLEECNAIIQRDLYFPKINEMILWMKP